MDGIWPQPISVALLSFLVPAPATHCRCPSPMPCACVPGNGRTRAVPRWVLESAWGQKEPPPRRSAYRACPSMTPIPCSQRPAATVLFNLPPVTTRRQLFTASGSRPLDGPRQPVRGRSRSDNSLCHAAAERCPAAHRPLARLAGALRLLRSLLGLLGRLLLGLLLSHGATSLERNQETLTPHWAFARAPRSGR